MPGQEDLDLAKRAVKAGLVSAEDIRKSLRELKALESAGEQKSLLDVLQDKGRIDDAGLKKLLGDEPASPNALTIEMPESAFRSDSDDSEAPTSPQEAPGSDATPPLPSVDSEAATMRSKSDEEQEPADLVGRTIGKYKIVAKLGKGGMGEVYKGEDTQLGRPVAIKLLLRSSSGATNERMLERFFREARAAAQIVHENIVQVYDMGEDEGLHYIAMEFVDGGSLQDLVKEEKPPAARVTELIYQAARGLAAAEERHIVHRDVKPSNILVTRDGVAKIADFGLAKNVGTDSNLTYAGQVLGTPHFMSPEQCDGLPTDSRADIYSLGATYYYALTRRYPYNGETALSVMLKHKTEPLIPPHERKPEIPKGISAIVQKMMAKKLSERYQSFKEVVADLDRVRRGMEPEAEPPPESAESKSRVQAAIVAMISIVRGRNKGYVFNMEENTSVTIGRDSAQCNLVILDKGISRKHCEIRNEESVFTVADCGSANGTFVNGQRIAEPVELKSNDRIQIGQTELSFRLMPRSKDALQIVRMAYQKGHVNRRQAEEAIQLLAEREARGEEIGMAELLMEKQYVTPQQAEALCRQLDRRIQVLIMKEQVAVPVPVPAAAPAPDAAGDAVPPPPISVAPAAPGAPAPAGDGTAPIVAPIVVTAPSSIQLRSGLFEGLMFCDQCGEYIGDDEIASGSCKTVGNNVFCAKCVEEMPLLGETLGTYMLRERLGEGRIGMVCRAEDQASQKPIALKLVNKSLRGDEAFVRALSAAVQQAAEFKHTNIAMVIDTFKAGEELVVRMPWIEGRCLRAALLRDTPQGLRLRRMSDMDRVLEIATQAAQALAVGQSQGVAHGELGPEKILLGSKGVVKVADLGLRTEELLGKRKIPQIKEHQLVGYLDYRAPELRSGAAAPSFQADQYSLGGIMYTMLTGKRFTDKSSVDDLSDDLPKGCRKVIGRMLERDPKRRYAGSKQLIRDLESI